MTKVAELHLVCIDILMSNKEEKQLETRNLTRAQSLCLPTAIVICSYANNLVRHHLLTEDMMYQKRSQYVGS